MKTLLPHLEDVKRNWYLVDAKDQVLGRLATQIALILRGKNKPIFTPFLDTGDYVVVINSKDVKLTGKKDEQKKYYHHSGYPSGLKETSIALVRKNDPNFIISEAVRGMIPKNKLGRSVIKKLKIYPDANHPHQSVNLIPLKP